MSTATFTLNEIADDKSLPLNSNIECNVSPLVVMSVLNHYQRRPSNKRPKAKQQAQHHYPQFVIGLLFGHKNAENNSLIINDSFGLETQMDQNQSVALELSIAKEALKLHALAHPNDRLVGWYKTGLKMESSSPSIHDMIILNPLSVLSNKLSKKAGVELDDSEYIHLLIDTTLKNSKLTIKTYTTVSITDPLQEQQYNDYLKEKKRRDRLKSKQNQSNKSAKTRKRRKKKGDKTVDNTADDNKQNEEDEKEKHKISLAPLKEVEKPGPIFYRFKEVKCNYLASESVKIGLEMIIDSPPEGNHLDSPSILMNDVTHIERLFKKLIQNLDSIEQYIENVVKGDIDEDKEIGWLIGDALSSLDNLSPVKFEQIISNRLQDFLMMIYLGKLTKAQLVIADKINKVLPSTVPGFEQNLN